MSLLHHDITPTHVFDGHNHPIKSETNAERQMKREKVAKELQAYYDKVHINNTITEDDYEIHIKNIKKLVYSANEVVSLVV